jgi:TolB-like protein/DNA-binding winged helix-turn-helix (wHTH) protein/Tfp pilus assembly protein PilF
LPGTVSRSVLSFGPFELELPAGELRKAGIALRLQPHPAKVLALLARHAGNLVTREEIKSALWGQDTFVDFEQGLNFCIRQIRQALHDNADSPLYIETLPRRGYRFIAPVKSTSLADSSAAESPSAPRNQDSSQVPSRYRWFAIPAAVSLSLLLGLYAGHKWLATREIPASGKVMLVVLPFENMSGDSQQEYFSEGLTDEIITDLGQLQPERLGVIARTSVMQYRHSQKTAGQIGYELGADYILEGGVSRGNDKLRVNAQLIQVRDQTHLWAESYEFKPGDFLQLQDEVAAKIADEIHLKLSSEEHARLEIHPWLDPDAHEAYLKGRFFWNRRTSEGYMEAAQYFRQAIAKDPKYAQAYAGLADTLALIGSLPDPAIPRSQAMSQAKAAAMHALELDDSLAEAHTSLAFVKMHYEWDWSGAEKEFQRALQLNPSYATAHEWHAYLLMVVGKKDAAIAEMSRARQLDPLSLIINTDLGELLMHKRDYDAAIEQLQRTLKMDPDFMLARAMLGVVDLYSGRLPEASAELTKASEMPGGKMWTLPFLGIVKSRSARKDEAEAIQLELENSARPGHALPYSLAALDSELGEKEKAFAQLEEYFNQRQGFLMLMKVDPEWDSLRSDPRFGIFVQRIGLP